MKKFIEDIENAGASVEEVDAALAAARYRHKARSRMRVIRLGLLLVVMTLATFLTYVLAGGAWHMLAYFITVSALFIAGMAEHLRWAIDSDKLNGVTTKALARSGQL